MSAQTTNVIPYLEDLKLYRQQSTSGKGILQGRKREKLAIHPPHPPPDNQKLDSMAEGDISCVWIVTQKIRQTVS